MSVTSPIAVYSTQGRLFYTRVTPSPSSSESELPTPPIFEGRQARPQRIRISSVAPAAVTPKVGRRSTVLAGPRASAKRFLRSVISPSPTPAPAESTISTIPLPFGETPGSSPNPSNPPTPSVERRRLSLPMAVTDPDSHSLGHLTNASTERPTLGDGARTSSQRSASSSGSSQAATSQKIPKLRVEEKPVASGNGIVVYIALAEPVLFLQGYENRDVQNRTTAMLRGSLIVKVTKAAKLKAITLNFRGKARTEWPEGSPPRDYAECVEAADADHSGIPPKKVEFYEENILNRHTWPFFNAQFPTAEVGTCADSVTLANGPTATGSTFNLQTSTRLAFDQFSRSASPFLKEQKRHSLQLNSSSSFGKGDSTSSGSTVAQRGYRNFYPGEYVYNFELPLDSHLPETINVELGSVRYELEATIERAGAFRTNVMGSKEVTLIRAPSETSLEQVEPIAISRSWEDQLHYDIVISGKSFPLSAQVPIAFKLTPLAKVQCHKIKVFVTENIEYFCNNKRVHRLDPTRKVLLFEKRADAPSTSTYPGSSLRILSGGGVSYDSREAAARGDERVQRNSTNLLGNLEGEHNIGPTEMEFSVQLPNCQSMRDKDRGQQIHPDSTYSNIRVHHWIKITMRLSKPDSVDPSKRRHFEISIDSPFNILSCQATQANIALPAYSDSDAVAGASSNLGFYECGCPGAHRQQSTQTSYMQPNASLSQPHIPAAAETPVPHPPPPAHLEAPRNNVQRPMHFLRNPSYNPPAFDAEEPPPPLTTPPPQYDSVVGASGGLADYFARLADEMGDDAEGDHRGRSRVDLPLTPGGRVNRSMDLPRPWMPVGR